MWGVSVLPGTPSWYYLLFSIICTHVCKLFISFSVLMPLPWEWYLCRTWSPTHHLHTLHTDMHTHTQVKIIKISILKRINVIVSLHLLQPSMSDRLCNSKPTDQRSLGSNCKSQIGHVLANLTSNENLYCLMIATQKTALS